MCISILTALRNCLFLLCIFPVILFGRCMSVSSLTALLQSGWIGNQLPHPSVLIVETVSSLWIKMELFIMGSFCPFHNRPKCTIRSIIFIRFTIDCCSTVKHSEVKEELLYLGCLQYLLLLPWMLHHHLWQDYKSSYQCCWHSLWFCYDFACFGQVSTGEAGVTNWSLDAPACWLHLEWCPFALTPVKHFGTQRIETMMSMANCVGQVFQWVGHNGAGQQYDIVMEGVS